LPEDRPRWEPSKRRLTWLNGARAICISGEEPERARGLNVDTLLADELPAWAYPRETWDLARLALRMGDARAFIATTPRTEETLIRILEEPTTIVSQESTLANRLHLSREFIEQVTESYRGTRFYRQEVEGVLIDQPEGAVFPQFDPAKHVTVDAEFVPGIPVQIGCDAGTSRTTGAVLFQVRDVAPYRKQVTVFADYMAVDVVSEQNALAIRDVFAHQAFGTSLHQVWIDPASSARTSIGPACLGEFQRVFGPRRVTQAPGGSVTDGLELIEILLCQGDLLIHPRATNLIDAFRKYEWARIGGKWLSVPASPQSPHEDMLDGLRYGLRAVFPEGRRPQPKLTWIRPGKLF
jgi:hypothetical protein